MSVTPVAILLLIIFSAAVVQPLVKIEKNKKGWKIEWDWKDLLSLTIVILVAVALLNGTNPVELIKLIKDLLGSK